jgi:tetratricopeptide (TPR) repeat protein
MPRRHGCVLVWLLAASVAVTPVGAQQSVTEEGPSLSPARPGLAAVPLPRLDSLETAVAEQIRSQQRSFNAVAAKTNVRDRDLADAYKAVARLAHAYEFFDAAEAAYGNTVRLTQDAEALHLLGDLFQQTGRYEEALARYTDASRARPSDAVLHAHLADVHLRLNRLTEARARFDGLLPVFPAVARAGLGEIALREGRFSEAADHFEAVLSRAPAAASVRYLLGMAYRGLGRLDAAKSLLAQRGTGGVRPVDPLVDELTALLRGERAQLIVGRRAYEAGQFGDAAAAFRKALQAAPSSVEARVGLGMALAQTGDAGRATEHLEGALRLDAGNATAHQSLGMVFLRAGRLDEAAKHLHAAFDDDPGDRALTRALLRVLLVLKRPDEAIAVFARASSMDVEDEDLLLAMSIVLADRQRYQEAVQLLDQAYREFPDRVRTGTTLARLLAAAPDRSIREGERAMAIATRVYEREPSPAHGETIALALAELGRCGDAAARMQRAITDADRLRDAETAARLRSEAPRYAGSPCRP